MGEPVLISQAGMEVCNWSGCSLGQKANSSPLLLQRGLAQTNVTQAVQSGFAVATEGGRQGG